MKLKTLNQQRFLMHKKCIIAQKTAKYRCTGAHKCVVGVVEAIGVSNIQWAVNTYCDGNNGFSNERDITRHLIHLRTISLNRSSGFSAKQIIFLKTLVFPSVIVTVSSGVVIYNYTARVI